METRVTQIVAELETWGDEEFRLFSAIIISRQGFPWPAAGLSIEGVKTLLPIVLAERKRRGL